jgi:hypothetical protein
VYAPHDLSREEMAKWKQIQRRRTSDVLDMLNTDPRKHYKVRRFKSFRWDDGG